MSRTYDLHSHSTISDGTLTPSELVARAAERGVDVLALTDHDSIDGVQEASAAAANAGVELIPGVEVSVTWSGATVHIVGLNVDAENIPLRQGLAAMAEKRVERARRIAAKISRHTGDEAVWQRITQEAGTEAVTRTHFARDLIEQGVVKDFHHAFKKWLGRKGKAYVAGQWAELEQAVAWIRDAGGVAVIAHPARYNFTRSKLLRLIEEFKAAGGSGLEVVSSAHTPNERGNLAAIARQTGLLVSCGSDFHAPGNPRVELGRDLALPANCEPVWSQWAEPQSAAIGAGK